MVEHFQPPGKYFLWLPWPVRCDSLTGFPITPILTRESTLLCNSTWSAIKNGEYVTADGETVSGVVYFYQEVRLLELTIQVS